MSSDTLISPKSDQSIRARYSDFKRRIGSPNFRDILRQRCRERVKAKRTHLFDSLRCLHNEDNVREAISQFIEMDLKELHSSDIQTESNEDVYMEEADDTPLSQLAASEQEKWILEEYDRMIENTNAQAELADIVTCPVCIRGALRLEEGKQVIVCSVCSLLLPGTIPLDVLEQKIVQSVDIHSQFCNEMSQFVFCPDDFASSLLLLCSVCGQCYQIV